ncbi:MAG: hypothetical protein HY204_06525 [Nitrospirae bacterium]|nr:hypothetical protein [Nitrospirota bacterium]
MDQMIYGVGRPVGLSRHRCLGDSRRKCRGLAGLLNPRCRTMWLIANGGMDLAKDKDSKPDQKNGGCMKIFAFFRNHVKTLK